MNDPNGFSYYHGQYHLFYQYNPYDVEWDAMHWGHAVSHDLLHWTYLPCAMAPDESYDSFGVFSGSAIELRDGRQLLMYTGVRKEGNIKTSKDVQVQCIAVGDGLYYQKIDVNPVLDATCLPEGKSVNDFRDPRIWREEDGTYRCIIATCDKDRTGCILLFSSDDCFSWKYEESWRKTTDGSGKCGNARICLRWKGKRCCLSARRICCRKVLNTITEMERSV